MKRREMIAVISALLMFCANVSAYPLEKGKVVFEGALIKQPPSPKYKSEKVRYDELMKQVEKLKQEKEKQRKIEEERKKKELENKQKVNNKNKENTYSRGGEERSFILTFYTNLPEENGGSTITCQGKPLRYGIVANNSIPLNTKIYLEGWGNFVVGDHGGNNFNSSNRLDVLIERNNGETKEAYKKRVRNMGKVKVKGWIVR